MHDNDKPFMGLIAKALLTLLKNVVTEPLATRQRDLRLVVLTSDAEDITDTGGEGTALRVLDVHNLEGTDVLLTVGDHTMHFGCRVGVPDCAAIVGGDVWHFLGTDSDLLHTAELVLGLLWEVLVVQSVNHKAALGVEEQTEVLVGLVNGDDVHEATGVVGVCADLAVDLDETLHEDLLHLLFGEGVLETVAQHKDEGQALAQLVGAGRRAGSPGTAHLVKHPVLGGIKALQMFLWSTSHGWSRAGSAVQRPPC